MAADVIRPYWPVSSKPPPGCGGIGPWQSARPPSKLREAQERSRPRRYHHWWDQRLGFPLREPFVRDKQDRWNTPSARAEGELYRSLYSARGVCPHIASAARTDIDPGRQSVDLGRRPTWIDAKAGCEPNGHSSFADGDKRLTDSARCSAIRSALPGIALVLCPSNA